MATSLSNLVNNLTEEIHKIKFNNCNCESNLIKYKCLSCNKDYSNKINEELKKQFKNTFKFPNDNINKFFLLLSKDVYVMIIWMNGKRLIKHHCLKKKNFIAS